MKTQHTPIVGDWLVKKDPIYGSTSQGRILKIENNIVTYFNANAFDGFGAEFEADLNDCMVRIEEK